MDVDEDGDEDEDDTTTSTQHHQQQHGITRSDDSTSSDVLVVDNNDNDDDNKSDDDETKGNGGVEGVHGMYRGVLHGRMCWVVCVGWCVLGDVCANCFYNPCICSATFQFLYTLTQNTHTHTPLNTQFQAQNVCVCPPHSHQAITTPQANTSFPPAADPTQHQVYLWRVYLYVLLFVVQQGMQV